MGAESVVYAVKLSPEAQERLRAAARFHQDFGYQDLETPEPELRRITRRFTGLEFDDLVQSSEITGRRRYRCVFCGEPFSLTDYNETRLAAGLQASLIRSKPGDRPTLAVSRSPRPGVRGRTDCARLRARGFSGD